MPWLFREHMAVLRLGLLALVGWTLLPGAADAQGTSRATVQVIPTRNPSFRIPFEVQPQDRGRIREVRLYYSVDSGQNWNAAGRIDPAKATSFPFRAPRDAEYWFAVQTLDDQGRLYPRPDEPFQGPNMRVVVDTTEPFLRLDSLGRRGSRAGVRWEIRDEHLDPKSLVIQYREQGARDWRNLPIRQPALIGEEEWDAGTAGPLLVQASVDDLAGNRTVTELRMEDGIASAPSSASENLRNFEPPPIAPISSVSMPNTRSGFTGADTFRSPGRGASSGTDFYSVGSEAIGASPSDPYDRPAADPEGARTLLAGSPSFALEYEVEDAGPTGPALVELWVTRDGGQTWSRQPEDVDRTSPYDVNLDGDGTYGLWLVVQSASGLGDRPPRQGDRPQLWVEVDTQPPVLRLDPPRIGTGPNLGKVLLSWYATDSHVAPKPVLLSYRSADEPNAPWKPITERLDNSGEYLWTVPPEVPPRFYLRIDVIDSVGNRAWVDTTQHPPLMVDRSRPRGRILGLDPGARVGDDRSQRR